MRARYVMLVLLSAGSLAACSSSSTNGNGNTGGLSVPGGGSSSGSSSTAPTGGSSGGGDAVLCGQLVKASQELGNASGALANPATAKQAFENAIKVLQVVGSSAPSNVKAAVNDLIDALKGAEGAFANPNAPDVSKLEALGPKLSTDAQTIGTYVGANCAGFHS